ncbi:methyltransferase [Pelomonas puraquae]|uniref:Methyltransferase n=1 Tax=Roseateles puraquae TaxID=431059 RepID=A0A254N6V9_9BURK|nr:methyltransferase [Roseateles puraquae]OWR03304.1 methyltransferase [Roseateles puraquae]
MQALQGFEVPMASALLSNSVGNYLLDAIATGEVRALQQLALDGSLAAGKPFIYNGHFYGKGFGANNKSRGLTLTEKLDDPLEGKKLVIEFSKNGLLNDTAYSRMSGSTRLFVYAYVAEITDDTVRGIPFAIGDLVTHTPGMSLPFASSLQLLPTSIDQFSRMDPHWMPSKTEFERMREVPEQKVKETIAGMLGELHVPADWGGEESDLFSGTLLVDGQRRTGAFLLKGPAKFHPMTMKDLGKNGDQVYRLFNPPADIYVVQHCHTIGPAVRKTVEAFALQRSLVAPCRFMFIDGYDTARLLRAAGEWPAPANRSPRKR